MSSQSGGLITRDKKKKDGFQVWQIIRQTRSAEFWTMVEASFLMQREMDFCLEEDKNISQ